MTFNLDMLRPVLEIATVVVGGIIAARLRPQDHQRAAHLAQIANDVAAGIVALKPGAAWAELVQHTVEQLGKNAATPTTNSEAIRRAAVAALLSFGKKPS